MSPAASCTPHEEGVAAFWEAHPCGDDLVGGRDRKFAGDYEAFFSSYDAARYRLEPHIPRCLDALCVSGSGCSKSGSTRAPSQKG
jgi:hypothetical protein